MKKIYINPNMRVIKVATQMQVLTMSAGSGQLSTNGASEWGAHEFEGDDW